MSNNIIQKRICISLCREYNKVELECLISGDTSKDEAEAIKQDLISEATVTLYQISNPAKPSKARDKDESSSSADEPATDAQIEWLINLGVDPADARWYSRTKASLYIRQHADKKKK